MGSAYAGFAEKSTGSLEPGKCADMVVWNYDLFGLKGNEVRNLQTVMTIVNGQVLYSAER